MTNKKLLFRVVLPLSILVLFAVSLFGLAVFRSDAKLPDLSKFEAKITCYDEDAPVKLEGVQISVFLLHKDVKAPYNEIVTLINIARTGKQFAARTTWRVTKEKDLVAETPTMRTMRRVYAYSLSEIRWKEMPNNNDAFFASVVASVPKEYLSDYRFNAGGTPAEGYYEAYRNILRNAGCSLHGPIG